MARTIKPKKRSSTSETLRQRATKSDAKPKTRRLRQAKAVASSPFKRLFAGVRRILRPFRFLLWPFKTKPFRLLGRFLSSILFLRYFRDSWRELRLVTWPSRRETFQLTMAVFLFAVIFGLMVAITDYGLDKIFRKVLLQ